MLKGDRRVAVVIGALRLLQEEGQTINANVRDIVTDGGRYARPGDEEIDDLCEAFNSGQLEIRVRGER